MIYVTLFIIILLIVYFIYKNGKLLLLKYDKEYLNELIKNDWYCQRIVANRHLDKLNPRVEFVLTELC